MVVENNTNKRPDMVLFVNGLPLVVITPPMCRRPSTNCKPIMEWKSVIDAKQQSELEPLIKDLLNKRTLLDMN